MAAHVKEAKTVGATAATANGVAGLLEAAGGAHQEAHEVVVDPLLPGAGPRGAVAPNGVHAGGVDRLDRTGLDRVIRRVGAALLARDQA